MNLFNKIFKPGYTPIPSGSIQNEISTDSNSLEELNLLTDNAKPVMFLPIAKMVPKEISYEAFIAACQKNSGVDKIVARTNENTIRTHITTYLDNNDLGDNTEIIRVFLEIYPKIIFKITHDDDFDQVFPKIWDCISPTVINGFKRNFLYHLENIETIIQVLRSGLILDINYVDNNNATFLTYFATNVTPKEMPSVYKNIATLINILRDKNYNFNNVSNGGRSIFCFVDNATTYTKKYELAKILTQIAELDILIETNWLHSLIRRNTCIYIYRDCLKKLFAAILSRTDYESFLCGFYHQYLDKNAEEDLMTICLLLQKIDPEKLQKMLTFVEEDGNTFVHHVAGMHYKKLLRIICSFVENAIRPNNDGNLPSDLYNNGKMTNIFAHVQQ